MGHWMADLQHILEEALAHFKNLYEVRLPKIDDRLDKLEADMKHTALLSKRVDSLKDRIFELEGSDD